MSAFVSIIFFFLAVATAFYAGLVLPPSTQLSELFSTNTNLGTTILPYALATLGFGSAAIAIAINRNKEHGDD